MCVACESGRKWSRGANSVNGEHKLSYRERYKAETKRCNWLMDQGRRSISLLMKNINPVIWSIRGRQTNRPWVNERFPRRRMATMATLICWRHEMWNLFCYIQQDSQLSVPSAQRRSEYISLQDLYFCPYLSDACLPQKPHSPNSLWPPPQDFGCFSQGEQNHSRPEDRKSETNANNG